MQRAMSAPSRYAAICVCVCVCVERPRLVSPDFSSARYLLHARGCDHSACLLAATRHVWPLDLLLAELTQQIMQAILDLLADPVMGAKLAGDPYQPWILGHAYGAVLG